MSNFTLGARLSKVVIDIYQGVIPKEHEEMFYSKNPLQQTLEYIWTNEEDFTSLVPYITEEMILTKLHKIDQKKQEIQDAAIQRRKENVWRCLVGKLWISANSRKNKRIRYKKFMLDMLETYPHSTKIFISMI